jgi:hypothetical protein
VKFVQVPTTLPPNSDNAPDSRRLFGRSSGFAIAAFDAMLPFLRVRRFAGRIP